MSCLIHAPDLTIGYALKRHPPHVVSQHIALNLHPGELVCLVGPNGSGKSTLLRTITGLQPPLSGDVLLRGKNIREYSAAERARYISLVLTTPVQAGQLRVYDLIGLGRYPYTDWAGSLTVADHQAIADSLAVVGIESFANRFIHELSDGERQKVMIARALAQSSDLIILDEPTAFLDFPYRIGILSMLRSIVRDNHRGVLLSTHDLDLALRLADRLWIISRDGTFYSGAPEDLVLSGVITDVFSCGDVMFDSDSGQFSLPSHCIGNVRVTGENGRTRLWTMRALHRLGYAPVQGGDGPFSIHISMQGSGLCWNVSSEHGDLSFMSLSELTRWISSPGPGAA